MFRISWEYVNKTLSGHGMFVFETYQTASIFAEFYNKEHAGKIRYFVESE